MTLIGRIVVGDLVWEKFDREDIEAHNLSQIENVWNVTLANNQILWHTYVTYQAFEFWALLFNTKSISFECLW